MSTKVAFEGNDRDAGVVEEICGYLTEKPARSFFLFAGAGSGKTRTLVEVLRRLTGVVDHEAGAGFARNLRMFGRSIRVITYTKNAVAVINGRLGNNDLVDVSTIHSFCWELIGGFDDDIRDGLIAVKTNQLEKAKTKASQKARGVSDTDLAEFAEIENEIEEFRATETFIYHPDQNTFGRGAIQHRHVLDVTAWLLFHRPTLRVILRDRHPLILIDESQDTMKGVLDALMELSKPEGRLTLGLLGDHRQRIYTDGHSDLPGLVPAGWAKPELQMNHRSQKRIVDLINKIWEAELQGRTQSRTGVKQHERTEKSGGVVRVFVGDAALGPAEKMLKEQLCADLMGELSSADWTTRRYQTLALEHKLVATRGDFLRVYQAMDLIDPNAAAPQGSGENKGPAAARLLLDELTQLASCVGADGSIKEFAATEVLQRNGILDALPLTAEAREARRKDLYQAMKAFGAACCRTGASVKEILQPVIDAQLFDIDARLLKAFSDNSPAPAAPAPRSREKEPVENRIRRGWCALFEAPWEELIRYRNYLAGETDLATHQVVKGSEFRHVMVVMDDSQAGGNQISYDKLFGAKELSTNDLRNIADGKETTIDRSLRLLYVTCSRARESLALVLWSENPEAAMKRIIVSGWFEVEEVRQMP